MPPPSRRLHTRIESRDRVWVYWECNGRRDLSRVRNLSVGGLFLETATLERIGAIAHLNFLVDEGEIRADGVVQHARTGGGLGLKFYAVSDKDRPNLAALMSRLSSST